MVRGQVDDVRKKSASCAASSSTNAACPKRPSFIKGIPANLLNLQVGRKAGRRWQALVAVLGRNIPPIQDLQQKLIDLQSRVVVPLEELKGINKRMNEGEATSRDAKKEMIEANLRLVISIAKSTPTAACSSSI